MKTSPARLSCFILCSWLAFAEPALASQVSHFSPLGETGEIAQVTVGFDTPVVALGNLDAPAPMTWTCDSGVAGKARWVDGRTWAVDFEPQLAAGVSCEFLPKTGLQDLAGQSITMRPSYRFNTGGPLAREVTTVQHTLRQIDEEAVFIIRATGDLDFLSLKENVWCEVDGISEKIPVRLLALAEKRLLLDNYQPWQQDASRLAALRCARRLPHGAKGALFWGAGIKGSTGLATRVTSRHAFSVRAEFSVKVSCQRENAKAGCNPFSDIPLRFSSPVLREDAEKLRLVGPKGRQWTPALMSWADDSDGGGADSEFVDLVRFKGPFPAEAKFKLLVPAKIRDDARRPLANRQRLSNVELSTGEYPPLLKFAADFGIVEHKAGGLLPLTLRNLDALPAAVGLKTVDNTPPGTSSKLRLLRLTKDEDFFAWKQRLAKSRNAHERGFSFLKDDGAAKELLLPKPHGAKAMEVVGIPLGDPGYYVLEAESRLLGNRLLGADRPMFVRTEAINTNLAVHFKKGEENQLVWVTALDTGKPVADARVSIRNCAGTQIAFGKTGPDGTMSVKRRLPQQPRCDGGVWSYFVSARSSQHGVEDFSFVLSDWQQGIESWRYQLPYAGTVPDVMVHTIFDRPLFRAGETVNMKHLARRHLTSGFGWVSREQLPEKAVIQLEGSDIRFDLPLQWKGGSAETNWTIPSEAKLGKYWVSFAKASETVGRVVGGESDGEGGADGWWPPSRFWRGGSFRVAEFRLPILKGEIAPTRAEVIGETASAVDLKLAYLAGGGAGGEKIRLRSEMSPLFDRALPIPEELTSFQFATPPVNRELMAQGQWLARDYKAVVFDDQRDLPLDAAGMRRATVQNIPSLDIPAQIRTEMEYSDPSGEIHTASASARWFPSSVLAGVQAEGGWASSKTSNDRSRDASSKKALAADPMGRVKVLTVDTRFKPQSGVAYKVEAWQIKTLVHRKRLIGGMYSYDTQYQASALGEICRGVSDAQGAAECPLAIPTRVKGVQSVQLVLQVTVLDAKQRASYATTALWLGEEDGEGRWYEQGDSDRIDLTPDRKQYQAGETAEFTVKMPFREAMALVSVEREGVIDRFVTPLSGKEPRIKVPIKAHYGPNVFVSALVVRGRIGDVQPTALVDLGKPAYKLGIAEIEVGRQGYALKVEVEPAQTVYRTREEATVKVRVTRPDGTPAKGGEFALIAVDEALLELAPNQSWELLSRLMARRGYAVETATAQSQVIGKRHFGLKAIPAGGGGGRQPTRELFDTLIKWQARVSLDERGEALVKLPLNDSLTHIRVVAVAHQGAGLFGTGMASFRTTKDVQIFSGLPPVVRDGDRFRAGFTVRNLTDLEGDFSVNVQVSAVLAGKSTPLPALPAQTLRLASGESRQVAWPISVPVDSVRLDWRAEAKGTARLDNAEASGDGAGKGGLSDAMKVQQKVLPSTPVKVLASSLVQIDQNLSLPVQRPNDALPDRGSVDVFLKARLGASTDGVAAWMNAYPYLCLEQKLSKALATGNLSRWEELQSQMPAYLDNNGLASYFKNPSANSGSPTLTAYILNAAHVASYPVSPDVREAMLRGLTLFIEGRIVPSQPYWSPQEDLSLRKLKVLEALARYGRATPALLSTIPLTLGAWPTSGLVHWLNILIQLPTLPHRANLIAEAEQHLRSRMVQSGTLTQFSREPEDYWWWLMDSPDGTAARAITSLMDLPGWQSDIPRLVRGVLSRQREGHWDNTLANVWGVLLLEKFARQYESAPVQGVTDVALGTAMQRFDWTKMDVASRPQTLGAEQTSTGVPPVGSAWRDAGAKMRFDWPAGGSGVVTAKQTGSGKPWLTLQTKAARKLTAPVYAGFVVKKTLKPIEQKHKGRWTRGDVVELELTVSSNAPWTWVVIDDPVPAGASILGSGLGGESAIAGTTGATPDSGNDGFGVQLAYTERAFDAYRRYYERFSGSAKTPHKLSYRIRLNNAGEFVLPPTRVEAMYAPENFGEVPNEVWTVAE